jgi:hypothetical protein
MFLNQNSFSLAPSMDILVRLVFRAARFLSAKARLCFSNMVTWAEKRAFSR